MFKLLAENWPAIDGETEAGGVIAYALLE